MVKTAWVYPLSGRWFHRFGQCVAFSLFMLQKWRWRFLNSLLDLFDLWRYSDFPARNWHGSIHGAGWNRSVGTGPLFQGYWLGITCHCILAQRLLHCHSSVESVLSISGTGKLFFFCKSQLEFQWETLPKSFSAVLPWSVCGNWWNTVCCSTQMVNITEPGQKSELMRPVDCPSNQSVTYPEAEYWKWVISCQLSHS